MHSWTLLITSLALTAFASPLEPRSSYPWISWFDNADVTCEGSSSSNAPWIELKDQSCHQFAPTTINVGWSWGAGLGFKISEIKLFSDANCVNALLHADSSQTAHNGYCLTTNQPETDYPLWNASGPPILSIQAGSEPSDK